MADSTSDTVPVTIREPLKRSTNPSDTPEVLQRRVMEQAEWKLLPQAVELVSAAIRREKDGRI